MSRPLSFSAYYFDEFLAKYTGYDDDKIVDILGKTLCKMSPRGHAAALELPLPERARALVAAAIEKESAALDAPRRRRDRLSAWTKRRHPSSSSAAASPACSARSNSRRRPSTFLAPRRDRRRLGLGAGRRRGGGFGRRHAGASRRRHHRRRRRPRRSRHRARRRAGSAGADRRSRGLRRALRPRRARRLAALARGGAHASPHRAGEGRRRRPRDHGDARATGARDAVHRGRRGLFGVRDCNAGRPRDRRAWPRRRRTNATFLGCSALVLATGGVGHLYSVTTNPIDARGVGVAMAARAGRADRRRRIRAVPPHRHRHRRRSRAARHGIAARRGRADRRPRRTSLSADIDPAAELAARDIVARGVFSSIKAGNGAFLDARAAIGAAFATRFPTVYASCMAAGIDP